MESVLAGRKGFSATVLKYIAISAMLIDHIAWAFVPFDSVLGQIMHIIGRITAPTMWFFIAEGYYNTSNVKKYALRLGLFAIPSHFAFSFFETGKFSLPYPTGMIYTLFLGLLALIVWDNVQNKILKVALIVLLCIFSTTGDWPIFTILFILAFASNRGNFKKQIFWFIIITMIMCILMGFDNVLSAQPWYRSLFIIGVVLAIPLLHRYNGQLGKRGKFNKWFFYIFYPLHLVILGILKYYIFI